MKDMRYERAFGDGLIRAMEIFDKQMSSILYSMKTKPKTKKKKV